MLCPSNVVIELLLLITILLLLPPNVQLPFPTDSEISLQQYCCLVFSLRTTKVHVLEVRHLEIAFEMLYLFALCKISILKKF